MDSTQRALQTNEKLLSNFDLASFQNFGRKLKIVAENQKIFRRIARREYWSNCDVLYTNGFVSTNSTN